MIGVLDIGRIQEQRDKQKIPPKIKEKTHVSTERLRKLDVKDIPLCAICCLYMTENLAALVPCGHTFHQKCLKQYSKLECPICRKQNQQSILLHFSIELNKSQSQEMKQNKQIQNKAPNQYNKQNQEINKLKDLINKGKQSIDLCISQSAISQQNDTIQNQRLKSCELQLKEISKTLMDIRNLMDNGENSERQIKKEQTLPQLVQKFNKTEQSGFHPNNNDRYAKFDPFTKMLNIGQPSRSNQFENPPRNNNYVKK
ncbi:unnamed protein product (macronuclear) [Paramecium tetraurelia]|uniref:RING-type domain-containing protein n=1 Tax=Paramecium tetraurelia TaxID=5888 RepID=A0BR31_PARTE|nr:uncharacterized protein GSPATT00031227001 [Paramecium tetraurelia]CAK60998.1 unnamed protein product [Paramecium tetraurelia]|eukprot:XP_001428396.1 hypothetical protein (macronuclear) [Paramecium tetraurelia strain d4-2]